MNEIKIFSKPEFGRIGALTADDGTPWFNAVDVCKALGLKNTSQALKSNVDPLDLHLMETKMGKRVQKVNFVNESGLYSLVLGSKKSNAQAFKRWVTSDVLPSLRKHGAYLTPQALKMSLRDPAFVQELVKTLHEEQAKVQQLNAQIREERPRVVFSKAVEQCETSILVRDLARVLRQNGVEIGEKRLYQWLRDNNYLCSHGTSWNKPTQRSMDKGLFEIKETTIPLPDGDTKLVYTTMVTGRGQVYFVNMFVHLTESELKDLQCEC